MYKQTLQSLTNFAQRVSDTIDGAYVPTEDLEATTSSLSSNAVIWGSVALIVLLVISAFVRDRYPKLKLPLFIATIANIAVVTLILIGSTIYLNTNAESGGPVHWHADYEVWACDQEIEFKNPVGVLSNKIGTSTLHEHNDKRIHLEGVVVEEPDASLGKFFYVAGGVITDNVMQVPVSTPEDNESSVQVHFETEDETDGIIDLAVREELDATYLESDRDGDYLSFRDGQTCPDGTPADVQAFAYELKKDDDGNVVTITDEGKEKTVYTQRKLKDVSEYVISDESVVPPGDCLIFEFSPTKTSTDKKCLQFEVQDEELGNYYYEGVINDSQADFLNPIENEQTAGPDGNDLPAENDPEFNQEAEL